VVPGRVLPPGSYALVVARARIRDVAGNTMGAGTERIAVTVVAP